MTKKVGRRHHVTQDNDGDMNECDMTVEHAMFNAHFVVFLSAARDPAAAAHVEHTEQSV